MESGKQWPVDDEFKRAARWAWRVMGDGGVDPEDCEQTLRLLVLAAIRRYPDKPRAYFACVLWAKARNMRRDAWRREAIKRRNPAAWWSDAHPLPQHTSNRMDARLALSALADGLSAARQDMLLEAVMVDRPEDRSAARGRSRASYFARLAEARQAARDCAEV